jgi:deazaflavin-dependent oxidoreductase (nitroreductase family)
MTRLNEKRQQPNADHSGRAGNEHPHSCRGAQDDGRLLVYVSQGGLPNHPDWYLNLVADPQVIVEVGSERYHAVAAPLEGEERDRKYAAQAERWAQFAEYQKKTDRVIPVVALTRR